MICILCNWWVFFSFELFCSRRKYYSHTNIVVRQLKRFPRSGIRRSKSAPFSCQWNRFFFRVHYVMHSHLHIVFSKVCVSCNGCKNICIKLILSISNSACNRTATQWVIEFYRWNWNSFAHFNRDPLERSKEIPKNWLVSIFAMTAKKENVFFHWNEWIGTRWAL